MAGVAVSSRVFARNGIGQFIRECDAAATRTVEDAIQRGAQLSRDMAPVGSKPDLRTIPLRESINEVLLSSREGMWVADARHAMAQEKGAGPHTITGDVSFFWEAEGRNWIPASQFYASPGLSDVINHPGNPPQPYLEPAYQIVMREIMRMAQRNYP